eukprot:GFUD01134604.1.p1 GENE.GFUD01134604.1~~GFUD01134604.1.p1  ORF type:complete len:217 (-),score=50.38 GFUD01134604.1:116-766(-)
MRRAGLFVGCLLLHLHGTTSSECGYKCGDRGGCQVRYTGSPRRGYSAGYCTRSGKCVATPRECRECSQHCKKYQKTSQPLLIEAILAEEDEDYDSNFFPGPPSPPPPGKPLPPSPPPTATLPPSPPRPTKAPRPPVGPASTLRPKPTFKPSTTVGRPKPTKRPITRPKPVRPSPTRPIRPIQPIRPIARNPFRILKKLLARKIRWKVSLLNRLFRG